ncbi:MAG TPA: PTS fructose transporter subunit IIA [Thioalkalivibrio sp.]|nr:PTS fructose transporter subunit IIA [Thioalkalivibrio sp.]
MSAGLLLVTHNRIGEDLLATATSMLGSHPLPAAAIAVSQNDDPDVVLGRAMALCDELDSGGGVLVITDMFGSTPSNIATRLMCRKAIRVVAGLNLPMLVRVFNYAQLPLDQLSDKAISGGHDGIVLADADNT